MTTRQTRLALQTLVLSPILFLPAIAFAQSERTGEKYFFGTVGAWPKVGGTEGGVGIGFEKRFYKGLAAGADFQGFFGGENNMAYGGFTFTTNGSYHFRYATSSGKLVPFATGGFSVVKACASGCLDALAGVNVGGGINYWYKPNRAFRVEFRDNIVDYFGASHKTEVRIGLSF